MYKKLVFFLMCFFYLLFTYQPAILEDYYFEFENYKNYYKWLNPRIYNAVYYICKIETIDIGIVLAMINIESGGNPEAISYAGARGLMQIMPCHYRYGNVRDLYQIELNVSLGVPYYKWCLSYAKGNVDDALKFYNAGPFVKHYTNWNYITHIKRNNFLSGLNKKYYCRIY